MTLLQDPLNPTKVLGPEALRGSGGILVNQKGQRFVNELDLRSVVAAAILKVGLSDQFLVTPTLGAAYGVLGLAA